MFTRAPRRGLVGLAGAAVSLTLVACGSGAIAAPVTSTVLTVLTTPVTQTATVTTVRPDVTVIRTVTKPALPAVTKVSTTTKSVMTTRPAPPPVTETVTITQTKHADAVTVLADPPAGDGGNLGPSCNSDVPTIVLQAITSGLSSDGIARAAGIHAMTESIDHPGTYLIAALFRPGGVAVWGIQGLSVFHWVEPANALARQLTVTRVTPGSEPFIDSASFDVQHAEQCVGD